MKGHELDAEFYRGKRILVTGGTGSIGSEIVRQLLAAEPEVVRIFSRDETRQYFFAEEMGRPPNARFLIGDVRDRYRLRRALDNIEVVFHAAAMKHVPACEYNPFEAVQTNVLGTQNVIQASIEKGVKRLIVISTDKAVNPVNTMGATKLLAERITRACHQSSANIVVACVRFGNVMGSRGSVVPLMTRQIRRASKVTLTDRRMTRFMMSIEDAVRLVLAAGQRAQGGQTFILKMPVVKIEDMVNSIVKHVAAGLGIDAAGVGVEVIGIRPGEKLHEELLMAEEIPLTEDLGDMFVIHPDSAGPEIRNRCKPIDRRLYDSSCAEPLSAEEADRLVERFLE